MCWAECPVGPDPNHDAGPDPINNLIMIRLRSSRIWISNVIFSYPFRHTCRLWTSNVSALPCHLHADCLRLSTWSSTVRQIPYSALSESLLSFTVRHGRRILPHLSFGKHWMQAIQQSIRQTNLGTTVKIWLERPYVELLPPDLHGEKTSSWV